MGVLISVVVPTCHRNDLLARCLDRLAPQVQNFPSEQYEVIVTDDGSNTTAEQLIRERFPWAHWVKGPQRGPAANRNFGASNASAPLVAFTDDDCVPDPNWLAGFAAAIRSDMEVYEGKTTSCQPYCPLTHEAPVNLAGGNLWSCNMLISVVMFRDIGGFDEAFPYANGEDTDLRERLRHQGYSIIFVSEAIIDHPAGPRKQGVAFARYVECNVLLWYKAGHRGFVWPRVVKQVISLRLRPILTYRPIGKPTWISFWNFIIEVIYVSYNAPVWIRRYYLKYRNSLPCYEYKQF